MKARLTENGILTLYNPASHVPVKVQVLYLSQWNMVSFLRVTDSRHLSPVMIVMQMNEKIIVGDVILIKKVQFQPSTVFKDEEFLPFIDPDLTVIVIIDYQIVEKKTKIGPLYKISDCNNVENAYWNSLAIVKHSLTKGDNLADMFFRENEKRLQLLRPDCNLLRERGNELFKKQNYAKAILHYDMAKQKDHFDARVWNNSSQAYFSNNEYDKAKRDALVALKLDPFNKKAYFRAGRAMEKAGDIKGALDVIEAGVYLCGPFEDLEKLFRQIKDSIKQTSYDGKKQEGQNSNSNNSKKKTLNGESINHGSDSTSGNVNLKKNFKNRESPSKKNKDSELHKQEKLETKCELPNETVKQNKKRILSFLEGAKVLYEKGKYKNALELYEVANANWGNNSKGKDIEIIRLMIEVCKIKLKYDILEDIKNNLTSMLLQGTFPFNPALHYWLANVYELLEDQDKVIYHANNCLQLLESNNQSYNLFWPGTKELIFETSPDQLKKWFTGGKWRSSPLAKCRHSECLSIQNHSLAKTEIYSSDIDFRGYVEVECEEFCSICYHPCCWKVIKERSDSNQLIKKTDKEYLGLPCFTPDCSGKISCIRIFDETSQLKNEIAKDKKDKKNSNTSKTKKKKDKKKQVSQGGKPEEKKKFKSTTILENNNNYNSVIEQNDVIKEENIKQKEVIGDKNIGQTQGLENFNLEGNYRILKPSSNSDDFVQQSSKKTKKNKKKKGKQLAQINITEDIEDRIGHNEYLTRLRALRAQREALESENGHNSTGFGRNKYLPECILDPDRPFYLPEHLQENPLQLESILRAKMAIYSSSDIDKESITTLLEFMYDWLKAQSPMLINDSRIKGYISENFPPKALDYVNKCGGIRKFLLQSFRFALIDEVICVNEQVVAAQEAAIHIILEKFKSPKFLISDGHKAVKLSHLLDDTKSTCSSNSSISATHTGPIGSSLSQGSQSRSVALSQGSQSTSVESSLATPYKNAALSKKENNSKQLELPSAKTKATQNVSNVKKNENVKVDKKRQFWIMDLDKFEVNEPYSFCELFKQDLTINNDKNTKTNKNNSSNNNSHNSTSKSDLFFHSDEELDNEVPSLQLPKKSKQPSVSELKDKIANLEAELKLKTEHLTKIAEEKELLSSQNQILNDRFSQIKTKSSVEIAAWKKSTEDAQEQAKLVESNLETYRNQKEGELRKLLGEKSRFQEEMKAYSLKIDSLQLTIDQLNSSKEQYEEEVNQKSIQLINFQDSAKTLDDRAKDAESKYLTIKRDLIKMNLEKTKKRLTAEMNKMRELLLDATEETLPSKSSLERSITEWEETIAKLQNNMHTVTEDCQKLLECIRLGRPLSFLPPGDLQIPSVPDLTVAHLLFVGKPITDSSNKGMEKSNTSLSTNLGLLGNPFYVNSNSYNKFGRPFMLGQLGVTPSGTVPVQTNDSVIGNGNGMSRVSMGSNLIGDGSLGLSISHLVDANSGFAMNGVSPSLTSFIGEDLNKGRSSNSSPISGSLSSVGSFSGTNEYSSPTFFSGNKPPAPEPKSLLGGGPLQWGFTDDHLKLNYGNLNSHAKEIKRPSKVIPSKSQSPVMGPVSDLPLIPPPAPTPSCLSHPASQSSVAASKQVGGGTSAFGLHSLLEASNRSEPRTVATPTTPTATKPKFQNLRSTNNIGAIGTLPPKVVRPTPRPGATSVASSVHSGLQSIGKDNSMATSVAYKRLIEGCKLKFGSEYPVQFIQKAIRDVREQNNNSLSGLAFETILDQVEAQLRTQKRMAAKPSVAPWAQLTQADGVVESSWQASVRGALDGTGGIGGKQPLGNVSDDHCAICLEILDSRNTMRLPCLHVFHIKCIKNWLELKSDCPICRKFALNSDEYPSLSHG